MIAANPDVADKIRDGKVAAVGALIGQVMREMKGQADAATVRELILEQARPVLTAASGIGSAYSRAGRGRDLPAGAATLPAVTTARRPAWRAAVAVVVLLAVGLGVALGVGSALGISAEPVAGMDAVPARGRHGRARGASADDRGRRRAADRAHHGRPRRALGCRGVRPEPARQRHPDAAARQRRPRRRHLPPRR